MQEADMAAAPLTVSDDRKEAVSFTEPFMTFGSAILMKKRPPGNSSQLPAISSIRHQST